MSLTPLLIALPLVGGYAFAVILLASLYHAARESGHRLYFRAVFYAVFLVIVATLIHVILFVDTDWYPRLFDMLAADVYGTGHKEGYLWPKAALPTILLMSFLISTPMAWFLNLEWLNWIPLETPKQWLLKIRTKILRESIKNNDFELMILRSYEKQMPAMFTLTSGKVYVGTIVRPPNPTEKRKAIRILPMISGYRDSETQQFELVTVYAELLESLEVPPDKRAKDYLKELDSKDFEVVFPADSVCSCHLFDLETYLKYFLEADQDLAEAEQADHSTMDTNPDDQQH